MTPARISAWLIVIAFACLALAFLTSCVSVPVPPFGDRIGEAGTLKLKVSASFEPRQSESRQDDAGLLHALEQFRLSTRTLRDK